jgi:hypothetical protein
MWRMDNPLIMGMFNKTSPHISKRELIELTDIVKRTNLRYAMEDE